MLEFNPGLYDITLLFSGNLVKAAIFLRINYLSALDLRGGDFYLDGFGFMNILLGLIVVGYILKAFCISFILDFRFML